MKYILVIFFFMLSSLNASRISAEELAELGYTFSIPVLSPVSVIELSEKYIANQKHIDLNKYYLRSLSFGVYNSNSKNGNAQEEAKWYVSYRCKPVKNIISVGCDFNLSFSNSKSPQITYSGGK